MGKFFKKSEKFPIIRYIEVIFMYPIIISGKFFTKKQRRFLRKNGFEWDGLDFVGYIDNDKKIRKLKYYCQQHKFRFKIRNSLGTRSSDYRRIFFIYHKPVIHSKYYLCAYCGRRLTKDKVTVDHLYPVGKAANSLKYQKKLTKKGVKNINDPGNLVAACKACNARKGMKTGLWIFRGKIGRYKTLWYIRWVLRLFLFALICYLLWKHHIISDILDTFSRFF